MWMIQISYYNDDVMINRTRERFYLWLLSSIFKTSGETFLDNSLYSIWKEKERKNKKWKLSLVTSRSISWLSAI